MPTYRETIPIPMPSDWAAQQSSGAINVLHQFSSSDGVPAFPKMFQGPDGNLYGIGVQSPFGVSPVFSTSQWRSLPPRGVQRCLLGLKSVQKIIPGM